MLAAKTQPGRKDNQRAYRQAADALALDETAQPGFRLADKPSNSGAPPGSPGLDDRSNAIEQTGKIWKLLILFGSLGLLIGVVWIIGLVVTSQTDGYVAPGVIAFGGLCSRLTGSMGKWWFHE